MKNDKLQSLLNKLVMLKTDTDHLKGFLFKKNGEYFIKPIEVYAGSAKEAGKFFLKEEHVEFTNFCESPKLMKVSMKSWHYRLMKYILGSNTPTPQTMQNGCPYFWLLVFCLLVSPFVLLWQVFLTFLMGFPYIFYKVIELIADITLYFMPEEKVAEVEQHGWPGYYNDVPIIAKAHFKHSRKPFMETFIRVRYGISKERDPEKYEAKVLELEEKRKLHEIERQKARKLRNEQERERDRKQAELDRIRYQKNLERKRKSEEFWRPFKEKMERIGNAISSAMTFDYKKSPIFKRTKQFIGFVVSMIVLAFTVCAVICLSWFLNVLVDGLVYAVANWWLYILYGLGALAILAAIVGVIYVIFNWIQGVIQKYKIGKTVWYVDGLLYVTAYPVKYLILGLWYLVFYVIWIPIKFIFYDVPFLYVLEPGGRFVWGLMKAFGGIVLGSIGIFGEYFGASKKDYCPGIEWVDTGDDE